MLKWNWMSFVCIAQLNFEDVLAEPDASHGFDPIWRSAFILFTGSRYWIYRLLSALLALPLALVWGIAFSLITFVSVWLATPVLRILDVVLFYIRKVNHPTTTNATPINLQRFLYFSDRSWWLSCKRPSSPWPALSALASTRGPAARRQRSSPFKTIKMEHSTSAIDSFYHAKPDTRRHADHKLFSWKI